MSWGAEQKIKHVTGFHIAWHYIVLQCWKKILFEGENKKLEREIELKHGRNIYEATIVFIKTLKGIIFVIKEFLN